MSRPYKVVDVFSDKPMRGNPVAVVLDASGLDTGAMQRIAAWTNLSETTFLLPPTNPGASYTLRIFTPRNELPFAGHPTLGSAHAVVEAGNIAAGDGGLIQECGVGLVKIRIAAGAVSTVSLEMPTAKISPLKSADVAELEAALGRPVSRGVAPATVNVGPVWVIAQFADANEVIGLKPDFTRLAALERRLRVTGVTVFGKHASGPAAIEVRSFAPSDGIEEDPVCGSGNGSVAAFQWAAHPVAGGMRYTAAQGRCVGRDGKVDVTIDADGKVTLGGACITTLNGTLLYEGNV